MRARDLRVDESIQRRALLERVSSFKMRLMRTGSILDDETLLLRMHS